MIVKGSKMREACIVLTNLTRCLEVGGPGFRSMILMPYEASISATNPIGTLRLE